MRPAGEIRQVLLTAVGELTTPDRGPTLYELACHTKVGSEAARRTLDNMRRHGAVHIPRTRRVSYRNRPVAEYGLSVEPTSDGLGDLQTAMKAWGACPA
jgi:hypothetical protein